MKIDDSTRETYRRRFLIAVALAVTVLFTVMIQNFLIALFFAVAFSSLIYPVYAGSRNAWAHASHWLRLSRCSSACWPSSFR